MQLINPVKATITPVELPFNTKVTLHMLREDLVGGMVPGNKARKLKYNILQAQKQGATTLLSFGGAYSNHIVALAAAGKQFGFKTVGMIRGEELGDKWQQNPTLMQAAGYGMHLEFISRAAYRQKESSEFLDTLKTRWSSVYIIPEGGTNALAIQGCKEILNSNTAEYNYICAPVGTGGTLAGIIEASNADQKILGFSALHGNFLETELCKLTQKRNWKLHGEYSFGGYAKINQQLITFINEFKNQYQIGLDPVYTAKMVYGIFEMIKAGNFSENSRILAVHTGGLQGIAGMNQKLLKKGMPLLIT